MTIFDYWNHFKPCISSECPPQTLFGFQVAFYGGALAGLIILERLMALEKLSEEEQLILYAQIKDECESFLRHANERLTKENASENRD